MLTELDEVEQILRRFGVTWKNIWDDPEVIERDTGAPGASELPFELYSYFCNTGDMPYGTMKARDGDPTEWVADRMFEMTMEALGYKMKTTSGPPRAFGPPHSVEFIDKNGNIVL